MHALCAVQNLTFSGINLEPKHGMSIKSTLTSMKRIQTDQSISGALIISDRMILQENVLDTGL